MKKFLAIVVALSLAGFTGCNPSTTGGKGTRDTKLKVNGPNTTTTVKHGDKKTEKITVTRGKDLKADVTLKAELADDDKGKGVSVSISPKKLTADKDEADLTFEAAEKAAAGEYKVTVTATPSEGEPAKTELTFKVPEKK
jgi:uncharacterized membrane protein